MQVINLNTLKHKNFLINAAYYIFTAGVLFIFYKYLLLLFLPFIAALAVGYIVQKPSEILAVKLKCKARVIAQLNVIIIYIFLFSVFFAVIYFGAGNLPSAVKTLTESLRIFFGNLSEMSAKITGLSKNIPEEISAVLNRIPENIFKKAASFLTESVSEIIMLTVKNIPSVLFGFLITVVASVYFARDFAAVKAFVKSVFSEKVYADFVKIKNLFFADILKIVKGYALLAVITFAELFMGLLFVNAENAILYAAVIALIDALPVLGTGAVLIPWSVISIISGNVTNGIILAIIYIVVTVVRNIIEPKVLGNKLGIPPILSLLALFIGLKLFGFLGMLAFFISLATYIDFQREYVF